MSITLLGALVHTDREAAKKRILDAFVAAGGDRSATAAALNTHLRTLYRLFERLDLWAEIDTLVEKHDFPRVPGPQRASRKIRNLVLAAEGDLDRAARRAGMKRSTLEARISELNLWTELNRVLRAASLPTLTKPSKKASAA